MPPSRNRLLRSFSASMVFVGLMGAASGSRAAAQGMPTASRAIAVSAFGGYLNLQSDYKNSRNQGVCVGLDITRSVRPGLATSFEVRGTYADGPVNHEQTVLVGIRISSDVNSRIHPYADFLVGGGVIHFVRPSPPTYLSDRSTVYSYGGGANIDIRGPFQAKVDFQAQNWNLGSYDQFGDHTFMPTLLLVGIQYRIPVHGHGYR